MTTMIPQYNKLLSHKEVLTSREMDGQTNGHDFFSNSLFHAGTVIHVQVTLPINQASSNFMLMLHEVSLLVC